MEREPIFNFEHDSAKPEIKAEKDSDDTKEKKDKKRKPRLWDRDGRQAERRDREDDSRKVKKAGEGVLGLAGKEKTEKNDTPEVADKPTDPHTFELPIDEAATESMYERPAYRMANIAEAAAGMHTNDDSEIIDAELIDTETDSDASPEKPKDIVDAEVVEAAPVNDGEEPVEASSTVPVTAASTAPFVFARPRPQQSAGNGSSTPPPPSGPGASYGSTGNTPPPRPHTTPPHYQQAPTATNFNTAPIPVPTKIDTDPFAYRRGKKRGFAQGLATGAAGGWLMGRRGGRKKLVEAEQRHQQVAEQQRQHIKRLEFEKNYPRATNQQPVASELQPTPMPEAIPRPSEHVPQRHVTPESPSKVAQPVVAEVAPVHPSAEKPVAAEVSPVLQSQHVERQVASHEADSKIREDAAEKLDAAQDQGGISGGGADSSSKAAASLGAHTVASPKIGPAIPHDPVAKSVTNARKLAHAAAQRAHVRQRLELAMIVSAILLVVASIVFFMIK